MSAGSWGRRTGTYTLSVAETAADDFATGTGTTGTVAVGGEVRGEIETSGDLDWFAVALQAGKSYRFDLEGSSSEAGTLRYTYLRGVYDSEGNRLVGTTDNGSGRGFNSRVEFAASETGTYYVSAGALGERTGTYTLSMEEITEDDFTDGTDTAGTVAVGGEVTVTLTDVPESPVFGETSYAFALAENADGSEGGISLGAVQATDRDGDALRYTLAGGNESGLFAIDGETGELFYIGAGEDYEGGAGPYALTVRASDGTHTTDGTHAVDATVTVTVTDVPEAPVRSVRRATRLPWRRTRTGVRGASRSVRCRRRTGTEMRCATRWPVGTSRGCSPSTVRPVSCSTSARARTTRAVPVPMR